MLSDDSPVNAAEGMFIAAAISARSSSSSPTTAVSAKSFSKAGVYRFTFHIEPMGIDAQSNARPTMGMGSESESLLSDGTVDAFEREVSVSADGDGKAASGPKRKSSSVVTSAPWAGGIVEEGLRTGILG